MAKGFVVCKVSQCTELLAVALVDTGALECQCVGLVNRSHVQIVRVIILKLETDGFAILLRWVLDLVVHCESLKVRKEIEGRKK